MSFDQLMQEAWEVRHTAVSKAIMRGETHPDYARHGVEGYFDEVPGLFKPFSEMPDPAAYEPMIEDLRAAMHKLSSGSQGLDPVNREYYYANPKLSRLTTASDYLTEWDGRAAGAFKRNFLDPFPQISSNQFILTAVCKGALEAHRAGVPRRPGKSHFSRSAEDPDRHRPRDDARTCRARVLRTDATGGDGPCP